MGWKILFLVFAIFLFGFWRLVAYPVVKGANECSKSSNSELKVIMDKGSQIQDSTARKDYVCSQSRKNLEDFAACLSEAKNKTMGKPIFNLLPKYRQLTKEAANAHNQTCSDYLVPLTTFDE